MDSLFDKNNIYLLEPIPSSEFGSKLKPYPTMPPKQRSLLLAALVNYYM